MTTGSYTCHVDGQLAGASANGRPEEFGWDGLALIHRGDTACLNEPAITGGNPVVAGSKALFNDMLGTLDPVSFGDFDGSKPDHVNNWYNVIAEDGEYPWNDWFADAGGQWGEGGGA